MTEQFELTKEQQKELDEIDERLSILNQETSDLYDEYDFREELPGEAQAAENWYSHHPKLQELERLRKHRKLLVPYSLTDSPTYIHWHRVPLLVFVGGCLAGDFIDDNIIARYATLDRVSNIELKPSDILERLYRNDFEFVVYRTR